jgi:ribosomal protein L37AE/L43A
MDTLSRNKGFVQMLESGAHEFRPRCDHSRAERLDRDSWYCSSCGSIVQEHEFDLL